MSVPEHSKFIDGVSTGLPFAQIAEIIDFEAGVFDEFGLPPSL
ncbi:MAG: hypothetical protein WAL22_16885 [Solirubrobacteraceae bacterium]